MFNPFTRLIAFCQKEEPKIHAALVAIEPYMSKAVEITAELSTYVGPLSGIGGLELLAKISPFLTKAGVIEQEIQQFVVANEHAPLPNILHNTAVLALHHATGKVADGIRDLDLAVQLAHNVNAANTPAATPVASVLVAAPVPPVAPTQPAH